MDAKKYPDTANFETVLRIEEFYFVMFSFEAHPTEKIKSLACQMY
jgi:hypothetical protein